MCCGPNQAPELRNIEPAVANVIHSAVTDTAAKLCILVQEVQCGENVKKM